MFILSIISLHMRKIKLVSRRLAVSHSPVFFFFFFYISCVQYQTVVDQKEDKTDGWRVDVEIFLYIQFSVGFFWVLLLLHGGGSLNRELNKSSLSRTSSTVADAETPGLPAAAAAKGLMLHWAAPQWESLQVNKCEKKASVAELSNSVLSVQSWRNIYASQRNTVSIW